MDPSRAGLLLNVPLFGASATCSANRCLVSCPSSPMDTVVQKVHHLCLLSNTLSLTPRSCFLSFWNFHDTDLPSSLLTQVMGFRSPVNRSPKGNKQKTVWFQSQPGGGFPNT